MLQALREKTSGWIAIAIVAVLAVPFAFFGMEQYLFQGVSSDAAKVEAPPRWWSSAPDWALVRRLVWESESITAEEFRSAFEAERRRRRDEQGERFDARAFENPQARREVLETLIDQAVMRLAARQAGIVVGDQQLNRAITSIEAFQVNGEFNPSLYQLRLRTLNPPRTEQMFRDDMRESLQQTLIQTQLAQSAFVTDEQARRVLALLEERRDVQLVHLPAPLPDTGEVSEEEIAQWHQSHLHLYRAPEAVKIEYVEIDGQHLPPPPEPDDASVQQRYEREKARFTEPEQRLVSHLLIHAEGEDPAAQKAAEDKAARLADEARQGADFAALVREHSDDGGSRASGGDLGWIERGMMPGPFEQALFAMGAGEISAPVKTDFGWHVLYLRELQPGTQIAFEQVRDQLEEEEREAARERQFNDLSGQVVDEVYRTPTSLDAAASLLGQPVQHTGLFVRGERSGFAARPEIQRAAFSESLIQDGTASDPINLGPQHIALIRVVEHTPERALTVEEARERVILDVRHNRSVLQMRAHVDALLDSLRAGESLAEVAAREKAEVHALPALSRRAPTLPEQVVEAFFQVPAPTQGTAASGKIIMPDNSAVLFVVNAVLPGDVDAIAEEQRAALRQNLAELYGSEDAHTLLQLRRRAMNIRIFESQL